MRIEPIPAAELTAEQVAAWSGLQRADASLESPTTGERRGFANLTELCAFLQKEIAPVDRGQMSPPACDDVQV